MNYTAADHTFALCAYGDSPYLEECILSLKKQSVQTGIVLATSTPSPYIDGIAAKYGIPVRINKGEKGIGADWNFAYGCTTTPLVTIAHQDDLYEPEYVEKMLEQVSLSKKPILWFCDYWELRGSKRVGSNKNMKIKHIMLLPLKSRLLQKSRFVRRRILSIGCPICCPAVTYIKEQAGTENIFSTDMKVSLDWDQWERQSKKRGEFIYCSKPLMCHRVHEESATTELIASRTRSKEDLEMFQRFWPDWIAKRLEKIYSSSEGSNQLDGQAKAE